PRVDILASDTQYVVEIELPGIRKEDINVRVNDDEKSITIEGSFPAPVENAPERVYAERRMSPGGKFARTIPLPGFVDKDGVGAKLTEGVLIVNLTKVEKVEGQVVNVE
ncbi:HSP20-like chaperone, partial [Peniophora sp. CONT]